MLSYINIYDSQHLSQKFGLTYLPLKHTKQSQQQPREAVWGSVVYLAGDSVGQLCWECVPALDAFAVSQMG